MSRLDAAFSKEHPLLLAGCGRMGGALARAWLAAGLGREALVVLDPLAEAPDGVAAERDADALRGRITPRAIVLAVKPQAASDALDALAPLTGKDCLLLSIAAGVRLERLVRVSERSVRAMPNTPAAIGRGITALVASEKTEAGDRALAELLMSAGGATLWLDNESDMDAVTALSGSGPAYVFALVEAMAGAGAALGLSPAIADRLARATVVGAAALMDADDRPALVLREEVTSPKGTTEAALECLLRDGGLPALIRETMAAAAARSRALSGT